MKKYDFEISVIIPVFNTEKYLKRCIDSIINQGFDMSKVEIILINDGSKDNSLKICNEYKEKFSNVIVIDKKNGGVSSARNAGLKIAKGKYILFVDSDDYISNNSFKELYSFFEKNYYEIDAVTYPIMNMTTNGTYMHFRYKKLFTKDTGIYDLNKDKKIIQANINVMIKNDMNIFFDEKQHFSEDEKFITELIMLHKKIGFVKKARYFYNKEEDNENTNKFVANKYSTLDMIYDYYFNLINEYDKDEYIQSLFINTLRWRISENKLFPFEQKEIKIIKDKLKRNLDLIDNDIIKNYYGLDSLSKIYIMKLKGEKITPKITNNYCQIYVNDIEFIKEKNIELLIYRFNIVNGKLHIAARINSPVFEFITPKLYMKQCKENETVNEINLTQSVYNNYNDNKKNVLYKFEEYIEINNSSKIEFYIEVNSTKFNTKLVSNKYTPNIIKYDNNIAIKSDKIDFKFNKFYYCLKKNIKRIKHPKEIINKIMLSFVKKENVIISFANVNIKDFEKLSTNIVDVSNMNNKKLKRMFVKCSYIITKYTNVENYSPFKRATKNYKDLFNFKTIWIYNNDNNYYNMKEYTNVDYVYVSSKKEKEEVINILHYNENEIIVKSK